VPFRLGPDRVAKYKLSPAVEDPPLTAAPDDRNYLGKEFASRLGTADARFELTVQLQTDHAAMPIDDATARWDETQSPPIPIADLLLPRQDVTAAGHAEFVENLAFNIWRVPAEHAPVGSIAEARRIAYQASADQRRTINGVTLDEPSSAIPAAAHSPELA
jgi:hypothetical protein